MTMDKFTLIRVEKFNIDRMKESTEQLYLNLLRKAGKALAQ